LDGGNYAAVGLTGRWRSSYQQLPKCFPQSQTCKTLLTTDNHPDTIRGSENDCTADRCWHGTVFNQRKRKAVMGLGERNAFGSLACFWRPILQQMTSKDGDHEKEPRPSEPQENATKIMHMRSTPVEMLCRMLSNMQKLSREVVRSASAVKRETRVERFGVSFATVRPMRGVDEVALALDLIARSPA